MSSFRINSVSSSSLEMYQHGLGSYNVLIWFFIGFVLGFGSVITSLWILFGAYVLPGENVVPGLGVFFQNFLIFLGYVLLFVLFVDHNLIVLNLVPCCSSLAARKTHTNSNNTAAADGKSRVPSTIATSNLPVTFPVSPSSSIYILSRCAFPAVFHIFDSMHITTTFSTSFSIFFVCSQSESSL